MPREESPLESKRENRREEKQRRSGKREVKRKGIETERQASSRREFH